MLPVRWLPTSQSSGASNQASTAVFDASNNLLFYCSISSASICSATNQSIGRLNAIVNPNRAEDELDWGYTSKEMVVAPVPGKPYFHYLFYTLLGNDFLVVAYAIIDCSGGTPVITQNSQRIDGTATYSGGNPGLAATKQLTDGTRRLYIVAGSSANTPTELSIYGGGSINFASSSGSYDTYQATFAQYVPGTNPAQFTPIGSTPDLPRPTNRTSYTLSPSYLADKADLSPAYSQQGNPGFGVVHQLILTVKSPCGTSVPVVYYFMTSDANCRPAPATPGPQSC